MESASTPVLWIPKMMTNANGFLQLYLDETWRFRVVLTSRYMYIYSRSKGMLLQ